MSKKRDKNTPISQPEKQKTGTKIVTRETGRFTGRGVSVKSATNVKNPDMSKGVRVVSGKRSHG